MSQAYDVGCAAQIGHRTRWLAAASGCQAAHAEPLGLGVAAAGEDRAGDGDGDGDRVAVGVGDDGEGVGVGCPVVRCAGDGAARCGLVRRAGSAR